MFTAEQIAELQKPLNPARIKQRRESGRAMSYIEGYDAIDRANEVFGFDGWEYTVVDIEYRSIGPALFYQATVRLTAGGVSRSDVGIGDVAYKRDLGPETASADAHGTAIKASVTDALKRALRTFGSQWGNDLYDKTAPPPTPERHDSPPPRPQPQRAVNRATGEIVEQQRPATAAPTTPTSLWPQVQAALSGHNLPDDQMAKWAATASVDLFPTRAAGKPLTPEQWATLLDAAEHGEFIQHGSEADADGAPRVEQSALLPEPQHAYSGEGRR